MSKVGLICAGGGMRGIYGTGVLDIFIHNNFTVDYCIAVSSGSANAASYLAKQRDRNYRFYIIHAMDRRYLSVSNYLHTGSFFGLEFIFDTLTNEVDPLDYETMVNNDTDFIVVATDSETGGPVYFTKKDISKGNYKVFMASCAVPGACRPVEINERLYYDGGISDPIPVQKCLDDSCDKIIAIIPRSIAAPKQPERFLHVYEKVLRSYPGIYKDMENRHIVYNDSIALLRALEKENRAMIITPSVDVDATMFTKNKATLDALYSIGVFDGTSALQKMHDFLK